MESSQVQSGKSHQDKIFFIKDMIDKGDVEVTYCPTKEMCYNVLTKPKKGKEFHEDRAVFMNCLVYYKDINGWEGINMIAGVSNLGDAPSSTRENKNRRR